MKISSHELIVLLWPRRTRQRSSCAWLQELRQAIRTLHDQSRTKLNQDYEMQGALENLFSQVQAVREGLATLSEAFLEESSKQHQRLLQVCISLHSKNMRIRQCATQAHISGYACCLHEGRRRL